MDLIKGSLQKVEDHSFNLSGDSKRLQKVSYEENICSRKTASDLPLVFSVHEKDHAVNVI